MPIDVVTGNQAAGYALCVSGEANRRARGCACGCYPITPQTEIVEYVSRFPFSKGRVVPVESEHSAMGVTIGAALGGARSFTASSANGLAYMFENIVMAGLYRLPIVMVGVNRTLGPPWNIWADQGDTLMLRDFPWIQLYCEDHQEVVDSILLAFRLGEDHRVLLPVLVCMDGFIVSHTQAETELPEQGLVDTYLPDLQLPHRVDWGHPRTLGGMTWPKESLELRHEIHQAMLAVPEVFAQARARFVDDLGRDPGDRVQCFHTEDAETILIASGSIATTARELVRRRRDAGERVGLVKIKMFRPFPAVPLQIACRSAQRLAVLDRNYAAGLGGIFWQDTRAAFQGLRDDLVIQGYLTGVCGGDVTAATLEEVLADIEHRVEAGPPVWMGLETVVEAET